jgi:hypothetical protein
MQFVRTDGWYIETKSVQHAAGAMLRGVDLREWQIAECVPSPDPEKITAEVNVYECGGREYRVVSMCSCEPAPGYGYVLEKCGEEIKRECATIVLNGAAYHLMYKEGGSIMFV